MKSGRFLTVLFMVVVLAGCSGGKTPAPSSPSSTRGSASSPSSTQESNPSPPPSTQVAKPAVQLDGVYRLDFYLDKQTRNGAKIDGAPFSLSYAFKSSCDGDKCIAVARQVRPDEPDEAVADRPNVFLDLVNGNEWVTTTAGMNKCGGGEAPTLQSWSLKPGDGGTLTGTRRLAFFSPDCSGAYEQPMSATKTGNVDADLTMPDPAKEAPLKTSAAEGFSGHYKKSLTPKDNGQKPADVEIDVSTTCIRNVDHCLTYAVYTAPGGKDRSVRAYQFEGKTWTGVVTYPTKCASGVDVTETTHSKWELPDGAEQAGGPLQRLTGTQTEVYPAPCEAMVESAILLERIGD
jgi:serine/threonine-protein kinase